MTQDPDLDEFLSLGEPLDLSPLDLSPEAEAELAELSHLLESASTFEASPAVLQRGRDELLERLEKREAIPSSGGQPLPRFTPWLRWLSALSATGAVVASLLLLRTRTAEHDARLARANATTLAEAPGAPPANTLPGARPTATGDMMAATEGAKAEPAQRSPLAALVEAQAQVLAARLSGQKASAGTLRRAEDDYRRHLLASLEQAP